MKIKNIIVLLTLLLISSVSAKSAEILAVGDSICNGGIYSGSGGYPDGWSFTEIHWTTLMSDLGHPTWTHSNQGVDGQTASYVDTNISTWITSTSPSYVYCHVGTNDACAWSVALNDYLASMSSIKTKCGATPLIVNQLLPRSDYISTVKLWNAALENWAYANNVKMSPVYQKLASTSTATEDYLSSSYASDSSPSIHPNLAGYTLMGHLMAHAQIPARKRVWGATGNIDANGCQDFGYVSWAWAVLSGSASVTENADTGVVTLAQNETADLTVECLPTGSKTIHLDAVERSGTATLYYRTAATTNFARNAGTSWTAYSGSFSTTDQFIQVRIKNESATPAVVRYAGMTWTGSALGEETDPEPETPSITGGFSASGGFSRSN